ncbi:hypothetical protein [Gemmatimonas sp.]|uniref:hypothetical protein n=1 Tax=Gemmatimonas sp. TaxID=1962908 RepID=UPI00398328E7
MEHHSGAELSCIEISRADVGFSFVPQLKLLFTDALHEPGAEWDLVAPFRGITVLPTVRSVFRKSPLMSLPFIGKNWNVVEKGAGASYMGRPTRRVHAKRRRSLDTDPLDHGITVWDRSDEYKCDIDRELSIGVWLAAFHDGEEIAHARVELLTVDGDFPPDIFTLAPPPDTRIMRVVRWPEQPDEEGEC